MKMLNMMLFLGLFLLVSCEEDQTPPIEAKDEPICGQSLVCISKMNWNILLAKKSTFPKYIEVIVNNNVVLDECNPNPEYRVERGGSVVEVALWNYIPLKIDRSSKFNLKINDRGTCYEPRVDYYFKIGQDYKVDTIEEQRHVIVNLTN